MVSKNNKQLITKRLANREVPHYSLRKLGIGVVSVLLGTTMYLGTNNTVANADTVASGSDAQGANTPAETETQSSPVAGSTVALHSEAATQTSGNAGSQNNSSAAQSASQSTASGTLSGQNNVASAASNTTATNNSAQSNVGTNTEQSNQSAIVQNNDQGQSQAQDPITNVGSVVLYTYNESVNYNGKTLVTIPYTYNNAAKKYDVINLSDYNSKILNDKNWEGINPDSDIIYRDMYNHVVTSFDPNTLADKAVNTPIFVDTKASSDSIGLDAVQSELDKHPMKLTNGAWAESYNFSSHNAQNLMYGPLTIYNPLDVIHAQQKDVNGSYDGGMIYADKTYPKERYAFYDLPQEYYKAFNNLA